MSQTAESGTGQVKLVISGGSVVVMGRPAGGPPPERQITLEAIIAPRGKTMDKPEETWSWLAKDFLRKLCVGKQVSFTITRHGQTPGRDFGTVILKDGNVNLGLAVVSAGWADVKDIRNVAQRPSYYDELIAARDAAKNDKKGMWGPDCPEAHRTVEDMKAPELEELVKAHSKKWVPAIVDYVRAPGTFHVQLKEQGQWKAITLMLNGVLPVPRSDPHHAEALFVSSARLMQRDVEVRLDALEAFKPAPAATSPSTSPSPSPPPPEEQQPQSPSARTPAVMGAIRVPQGEISLELVRMGLAKVVASARFSTLDPVVLAQLRAAEKEAQKQHLRMWTGWTAPVRGGHIKREFVGRVVEVPSGDTLYILPDTPAPAPAPAPTSSSTEAAPGATPPKLVPEARVSLANCRAPRLAPKSDEHQNHQPWAWESREQLRKLVLGKQVRVQVEHSRPIMGAPATEPERDYASVFLGETNVGVRMVEEGLLFVAYPARDQPCSAYLDDLREAEEIAKSRRRYVHRTADPARQTRRPGPPTAAAQPEAAPKPVRRPLPEDTSVPLHRFQSLINNRTLFKEYRPKFFRGGRMTAVVEGIVNAARFRLFVPREDCMISFVLAGVRAPNVERVEGGVVRIRGEPYAAEALQWARLHLMNREVEILPETTDQSNSNFFGQVYLGGKDLSEMLLVEGLARLAGGRGRPGGSLRLEQVEEQARAQKKGLWAFAQEEPKEEAEEETEEAVTIWKGVRVTDVIDAGAVAIQILPPCDAALTAAIQAGLAPDAAAPLVPITRVADVPQFVAFRASEGTWQRGKVLDVDSGRNDILVRALDYYTEHVLRLADKGVHVLPDEFLVLDECALPCCLAFVQPPDDDYRLKAEDFVRRQTEGKLFDARLEFTDAQGRKHVTLLPSEAAATPSSSSTSEAASTAPAPGTPADKASLNYALLRAGLGLLDRSPEVRAVPAGRALFPLLDEAEKGALREHINIWINGDFRPDEEEVKRGGPRRGAPRRR